MRGYGEGMAPRPLLFLDVDGVISVPGSPPGAPGLRVPVPGEAGLALPAWPAPGIRGRLAALDEAFAGVWATAWRQAAPALGAALGSGAGWPVLDWDAMKLPALLGMAAGRRFAFVDDDGAWEACRAGFSPLAGRQLLISPDPSEGLQDFHVRELLAFAAGGG